MTLLAKQYKLIRECAPREEQGKPRNSKEKSLHFLGFLWPILVFSMAYSESK